MKQILFIRGGEIFTTREEYLEYLRWYELDLTKDNKNRRDRISDGLSHEYESMVMTGPNKRNAKYDEREIWFQKYLGHLHDESPVIVWSSLWGMFILKWLTENTFPKNISQLHLVCPPIMNEWHRKISLETFLFDLWALDQVEKQCDKIYIYHSKDDHIVPYSHSEKLAELLPSATFESFETRGHFYHLPAFPELFDNIAKHSGIYGI